LRQAIDEANLVPAGTDVTIEVKPEVAGVIPFPNAVAQLATTAKVSPNDSKGAVFWVKRAMNINLDNRLSLMPPNSVSTALGEVAGILVDGPNVNLKNFTNWFSTQSAIVFSPNSDGSSLDGGSSIQTNNGHTNRQVSILGGADKISIRNYTMGRQYPGATNAGIVFQPNLKSETNISETTISNVTIDNTPVANGKCIDGSDGRACFSDGIYVTGVRLNNLIIESCKFTNFWVGTVTGTYQPIDAGDALGGEYWDIRDNIFTDIRVGVSQVYATIRMPSGKKLGGTNYIRDNIFDNSASGAALKQGMAISVDNWINNYSASGLFIEDNYFDGYGAPDEGGSAIIRLNWAGVVTVRRNVFGPATVTQSDASHEETASNSVMLNNNGIQSNQDIKTWYPSAASYKSCSLEVTMNVPALSGPKTPVAIDFYWTATYRAEKYLGSVELAAPGTASLPAEIPGGQGFIRVQTQGSGYSQPESSQYSRTLAVTGSDACTSKVEVDLRAWTNVPAEATSYDQIITSGKEVLEGGKFSQRSNLWLTYTVTNIGSKPLSNLVVYDSQGQQVCTVLSLAVKEVVGCARRRI
jgi:hypothetical protein